MDFHRYKFLGFRKIEVSEVLYNNSVKIIDLTFIQDHPTIGQILTVGKKENSTRYFDKTNIYSPGNIEVSYGISTQVNKCFFINHFTENNKLYAPSQTVSENWEAVSSYNHTHGQLVSITQSGTGAVVQQMDYEYEYTAVKMTAEEHSNDNGTNPRTVYTSYANLATEQDPLRNITTFEYDTLTQTFISKITYPDTTNPVTSTVTQYIKEYPEYDYCFGKPKQIKDDIIGTIYNYTYDSLHRLMEEYTEGTAPVQGKSSIVEYSHDQPNVSYHAPYSTVITVYGTPNQKIFAYDANGNMTASYNFSFKYDATGNKLNQSNYLFTPGVIHAKIINFDINNIPKTIHHGI